MNRALRTLHVEDSERDAALLIHHLKRAGYELTSKRVDTYEAMKAALETEPWDLILCDYSMPHFNALAAVALLKETGLDIPFIIISGTVGEDVAVEAMRAGAHDYLMKENLVRLAPTIERELQEAENRRARRRAEGETVDLLAEIRSERRRLNNIVANVPGVVWEAWAAPDASMQRTDFVSDYVEKMLGYTAEEWVNTPNFWLTIVHPEDRERTAESALAHYYRGGQSTLEFRWVGKDGRMVWVESHSAVITDDKGRAIGVRGVNTDIGARKRAEEAVRQAEEKYRGIFENAVEGIFQSTTDGKFISVNPAMARILGYGSPEELIAHRTDIGKQHYGDPNVRQDLEKLLSEQGIVVGYECEVYRKDRTKIWTAENVRAIRDRNGQLNHFEGSIEDITERKMLADQLRQSHKLEAIGQLAGGIAHDFNNLLTVVNGYSDLAIRRMPAEDPLRRSIVEIRKAGERAASLTRQLLAFSRKQVLQPKILSIDMVVSDIERMLRRLIGEDIELKTIVSPDLGNIKADPSQIEQVLMNLAINARDAMPDGGKLLIEAENVSLDEEYTRQHIAISPGQYVMLAVSDTGTGMDAKTQAHIFEPFFTTKGADKGTGLGLSTVYGIVKQSGGNIWVYSEVGQGTTFKIYLPRVSEYGAQERKRSGELQEIRQGTETILLAEDEEMVRDLAREVLIAYGYRVLEAASGDAALTIGKRHKEPIQLLITDVVMPEMSGHELSVRLAEIRPEMKILFMSGYTDNAIVHQGILEQGANFIQKPFSPDAFAHKVRGILYDDMGKI